MGGSLGAIHRIRGVHDDRTSRRGRAPGRLASRRRGAVPGFQFIQDDVEYRATPDAEFFGTHHTNMDVYDRLQREDLMQAAVVMASCVYHAAMRDERFPRKPLPQDPPAPAAPAQPSATR